MPTTARKKGARFLIGGGAKDKWTVSPKTYENPTLLGFNCDMKICFIGINYRFFTRIGAPF